MQFPCFVSGNHNKSSAEGDEGVAERNKYTNKNNDGGDKIHFLLFAEGESLDNLLGTFCLEDNR